MPTTTIARVRTVFTGVAGTPAYSNFYFDDDGTAAGVYQSAVLDFWNALNGAFAPGVTWTMVNPIPIIESTTGQVVSVVTGDGGTGTESSSHEPLPFATSGLLQLHSGVFVAGREVRGRCFIPYPHEQDQTTGKPGSDYINAVQDAADTLLGSSGSNGAWAIWSRANARFELVTSTAVWSNWAVMRSRRD